MLQFRDTELTHKPPETDTHYSDIADAGLQILAYQGWFHGFFLITSIHFTCSGKMFGIIFYTFYV